MTIRILPPRLANQIAAGEVVERPASVIKELVENSLDAGATQLEVLVEQGGHKRIQIRDNGCGISKDELKLALSRHATSKVSHLDDIESIATLGFRGEALASISSVARLTLTSKTAEQSEAWLAYAEGRDMQVQIQPAAHPNGTSIEVSDLFFNTPARRKFLRAEKTEFHHIDELIKRLAMARFDVGFRLVHNGKVIRNLPVCQRESDEVKRLGAICGQEFARQSIHMSAESGNIKVSGWLMPARCCGQQSPAQYTFINGRMIRDKVLTHAIRQSYADWLPDTSLSAYALYLSLPFSEVDVNVHPAKHEVRFSQARLVHDFVVQAVQQALQAQPVVVPEKEAVDPETGEIFTVPTTAVPSNQETQVDTRSRESVSAPAASASYGPSYPNHRQSSPAQVREQVPSKQHWQSYQALMSPSKQEQSLHSEAFSGSERSGERSVCPYQCIAPHHAVLFRDNKVWLLDVKAAEQALVDELYPMPWTGQPLLLPLSVPLKAELAGEWQELIEQATGFGINIHLHGQTKLIIKSLPALLRQCDLVAQLDALKQALAEPKIGLQATALLALAYQNQDWQVRTKAVVAKLPSNQGELSWLHSIPAEQLITLFNS